MLIGNKGMDDMLSAPMPIYLYTVSQDNICYQNWLELIILLLYLVNVLL